MVVQDPNKPGLGDDDAVMNLAVPAPGTRYQLQYSYTSQQLCANSWSMVGLAGRQQDTVTVSELQ